VAHRRFNVPGRVITSQRTREVWSSSAQTPMRRWVSVSDITSTRRLSGTTCKCLDAIAQVQDFAVVLAFDVGQPDLPTDGMPLAACVKDMLAVFAHEWPGASNLGTG